jgi:hypothetical protein
VALLLFVLLAAGLVTASDPPHWYSSSLVIGCGEQCHTLHQAEGGQLTGAATNVNLCQSCHNASGLAGDLPMDSAEMAVPGNRGTSHAFGVAATNVTYQTLPPQHPQMSLRLPDGDIICSTCHDQHVATAAVGGTPRISAPVKVADLGGAGTVSSAGDYTGAAGVWYLVEIDGGGSQSSATFRWSKDNGVSWMAELVGAGDGAVVDLDFGVQVVFDGEGVGDFPLGESWEFSASYPFLRDVLDSGDNTAGDRYCRDCHRDWMMTHDGTGGTRDWDGDLKSHPVGEVLNANGRNHDRAIPLDGNGGVQGVSGDANPTNDLRLDGTGRVQCLSCHGIHYADSNTQTVDEYTP